MLSSKWYLLTLCAYFLLMIAQSDHKKAIIMRSQISFKFRLKILKSDPTNILINKIYSYIKYYYGRWTCGKLCLTTSQTGLVSHNSVTLMRDILWLCQSWRLTIYIVALQAKLNVRDNLHFVTVFPSLSWASSFPDNVFAWTAHILQVYILK